jgi:hypothetical protein
MLWRARSSRCAATVDKAWATASRDQSPGTRSQVVALEIDGAFSTPERTLYNQRIGTDDQRRSLGLYPHAGAAPQQFAMSAVLSASAA